MNALVVAAARFLTRVAAIFLLAMVAINVVDVGLRSGFNAPIFGTHEIVELMLAAVAFLAIPECFLRGQHIRIELIDQILPPRGIEIFQIIGTLTALLFVGLLTFHMISPALDYIEFNEITMDLQIPLIWKGTLIFAGIGLSIFAVIVMLVRDVNQAAGSSK